MRRFTTFSVSALLLLFLGIAAPGFARQDRQQQGEKAQKEEKGKANNERGRRQGTRQSRPQQRERQPQQRTGRQEQRRPAPQAERQRRPQQRTERQQAQRPATRRQPIPRSSTQGRRVEERQQGAVWREHRARNWQSEHRTWEHRGGYRGYRIPATRYNAYFGPRHGFRVYGLPMIVVGGYPRFQYQGYWIGFLDPWPPYWPEDWYQTDDVFVVYSGGGYYLYNARYPAYRVAVSIYLR